MIANMKRTPPPDILARIGKPVEKKPEQIRTLILNAVGAGFNTMRTLKEETKIEQNVIVREIEILKDLYITVLTEPIESYWLKGKAPAKVYIENGRAIAVKGPKKSKKADRQIFEKKRIETEKSNAQKFENFRNMQIDKSFGADEFKEIPLDNLIEHAENPRGFVDTECQEFFDLRDSIKSVGVQEPLIVAPIPGTENYRIVIGHRRAKASQAAGLETAPCIVRRFASTQDEENVMLIENIQRANLSPMQEARAFKKIFDKEKNIHAVARVLGLTQNYISDRIKLLSLEPGIQIMVERNELNITTAKAIATLSPKKQLKILPRALSMKSKDFELLVAEFKKLPDHEKIPAFKKRKKREKKRVTTDDEKFTRTGALKSLEQLGEGAWITVKFLRESFDDVCIDACLEAKDETVCNGCPMPRFIASVTRRIARSES